MLRAEHITAIDLTDVKSADGLNHSKFAESPEVVRSIGQSLASGQTFTEKSGLGATLAQSATGAAATVGSAAGLAVSAPLAIVDGRTRDEMGERFDAVGANLSSTLHGDY
jgi:esterase/lipase superfamily enzyme